MQVIGKIVSTNTKEKPLRYAEITISKKQYPNFPHKKGGALPIILNVYSDQHSTIVRERFKLKKHYWISQKDGLWNLLKKNGFSLNENILLSVDVDTTPITICITTTENNNKKQFKKDKYYPEENENATDRMEGAIKRVIVDRYERNHRAREDCLNKYGYLCVVCGFDFETTYGEIGKHFIHIHHLTPLSEIRGEYKINGAIDLRPVCPNCHSMLHRFEPCLSISELQKILRQKK